METHNFVVGYITEHKKTPSDIDWNSVNIIKSGLLDSIEIFAFVLAIEAKYDIAIDDSEISDGSLETIAKIRELIARKKCENR